MPSGDVARILTRATHALGDDEPAPTTQPGLPDIPAYQHVLTVIADAQAPLRAKDLCHAPDAVRVSPPVFGADADQPAMAAVDMAAVKISAASSTARPRSSPASPTSRPS